MPRKLLSTLASKRNGPVVFNEQALGYSRHEGRKKIILAFGIKFMFIIIKSSMLKCVSIKILEWWQRREVSTNNICACVRVFNEIKIWVYSWELCRKFEMFMDFFKILSLLIDETLKLLWEILRSLQQIKKQILGIKKNLGF